MAEAEIDEPTNIDGTRRGADDPTRAVLPGVYQIALPYPPGEYERWIAQVEPTPFEIERQRTDPPTSSPVISIVVPVYRTPLPFLRAMLSSVVGQTYGRWELCIAVGGELEAPVRELLEDRARSDVRVKIRYLAENRGIAGNSNEALALATGDYVAFLDHDDELAPFALQELVRAAITAPDADFLYSDEDKIDESGRRFDPKFKPDWSPDFLRSSNYITHFMILRRDLLLRVGQFRPGLEGSQDYDLALRATERAGRVVHIPHILYHWRMHPGSVSEGPEVKLHAYEAARAALREHLSRCGQVGEVRYGKTFGAYEINYALPRRPLVSIVIPTRDQLPTLRFCLRSLWLTDYRPFEVILVDNDSAAPTHAYYATLGGCDNVRVVAFPGRFNFSSAVNLGVRSARGEVIVLLNNDTQIINNDWLERMLEHALQPGVGVVGAKLYYPDDRVQHAGVIIGAPRGPRHAHLGWPRFSLGYMTRLVAVQNVTAVTGACLMVRKALYEKVGGFDEGYPLALSDIDFCMKMRAEGCRNIWTHRAELYHVESLTRGYENTPEQRTRFEGEIERFRTRWRKELAAGDPYYHPRLSLHSGDFQLLLDR